MIHVLMVGRCRQTFKDIESVLKRRPVETVWVENGTAALDLVADARETGRTVELVIMAEMLEDMTNRTLVEQIVAASPMTNCAVVSSMAPEKFHDAFEGYGVLMQLPGEPGRQDGEELVACMKKIRLL